MVVEETPKFFVDAAVPSMDFVESLCSEASDVKMTKNFGLHIQDSLPKESSVKRRASPCLTNIEKGRKPNEISKELIPDTPKESFIPEVVGGKSRESHLKRRASPRLKEIPESKRPYYGPFRKESYHHPDEEISKAHTCDASKISREPKIGEMQIWESSEDRRFSPRLKGIPQNERPYYGPKRTEPQHCSISNMRKEHNPDAAKQDFVLGVDVDSNGNKSFKNNVEHRKENGLPNAAKQVFVLGADGDSNGDTPLESGVEHFKENGLPNGSGNQISIIVLKEPAIVNAIPSSSASEGVNSKNTWNDADEKRWADEIDSSHSIARVKETLRLYNKYYLQFLQKTGAVDEDVPSSTRADLQAYSLMKKSNEVLYPEKRFGHLPGICVGYQFYSRCAMAAVGLHSHWLNGIDYMGTHYKKMDEFKGYTFPLAVAIVLSGQYEDDQDNSEEIVYTGQGGNDLLGKKHQIKDQKMTRGNLALENNMKHGLPVRVVRGHKMKRKTVKVYTYDGLYKVVECWNEKGVSGFVVFKYRLQRLLGQPKLISNQVHFKNCSSWVPRLPNLVCDDISVSQEDFCIPAINSVDDAPLTLKGFVYTKSIQVAENLTIPPNAVGCNCKGKCTNPRTCACAKLNGSDFPYVRKDGGRLIEAKDVVVECGPNCGCGPSCINRISQQGIKYHLEVFRTEKKGWAVKTIDFIPSGAPVCEYIGVLRKTNELDNVAGNDYLFEIDCLQTMKEIDGRERRLGDVSASASKLLEKMDKKTLESSAPEFCIDAGSVGNVARFINHSCEPNLFVQCVLSTHHDLRLARVVLFAADDIAPLQELTYDYGYALDSVIDSNGNIRREPCYCGTAECRKRLF